MKISVLKTFWVDCFTEPHSPLSCSVTDLHIADIPGKARKKTCVHIEIKGERERERESERERISQSWLLSPSAVTDIAPHIRTQRGVPYVISLITYERVNFTLFFMAAKT